jgi:hypothetical protein
VTVKGFLRLRLLRHGNLRRQKMLRLEIQLRPELTGEYDKVSLWMKKVKFCFLTGMFPSPPRSSMSHAELNLRQQMKTSTVGTVL